MTAKDDMLQLAWIFLGMGVGLWIVLMVRETAFQSGYWKGRKDGWNMHNRMTSIKRKSDEVFDYDKQG
jgi:hypothetical protein